VPVTSICPLYDARVSMGGPLTQHQEVGAGR